MIGSRSIDQCLFDFDYLCDSHLVGQRSGDQLKQDVQQTGAALKNQAEQKGMCECHTCCDEYLVFVYQALK